MLDRGWGRVLKVAGAVLACAGIGLLLVTTVVGP